jgi:hypothetical protein
VGIKKTHEHPEKHKACYQMSSIHPLKEPVAFGLNDKVYAVAYMTYTGRYYIYDTETGKEVGEMKKEFYDDFMGLLPWYTKTSLEPDPDCLVAR